MALCPSGPDGASGLWLGSSRVGVGDQLPFQSEPPIKLSQGGGLFTTANRDTVVISVACPWYSIGTAKVLPKLQLLCKSIGRCGTSITVTFL